MGLRLFRRRRSDRIDGRRDAAAMAETIEDERAAEEGEAFGLAPDLAVWLSRDELAS